MIHAQFNFEKDEYEVFRGHKSVLTLSNQDATDMVSALLRAGLKYQITDHKTSFAMGENAVLHDYVDTLKGLIKSNDI